MASKGKVFPFIKPGDTLQLIVLGANSNDPSLTGIAIHLGQEVNGDMTIHAKPQAQGGMRSDQSTQGHRRCLLWINGQPWQRQKQLTMPWVVNDHVSGIDCAILVPILP